MQRRLGDGFARVLLPGLGQTLQCPVVLCGDDLLEFCCLVLCDGSLSAGDGLWFQVLVFRPAFLEPLHAGEGNTEACGYLFSGLSALQGVEDALAKIGGERSHTLRIAQSQCFREGLYYASDLYGPPSTRLPHWT